MRRKSLLIPLLVFVLSFVTLSFYQKSNSTVTLASTTDMAAILWSKTTADISKVVYSVGDKQIIVSRNKEDWFLTNVNNKQADSLYIYTAINSFLEPKFKEVIKVSPENLETYGIDEFSPTITLYDTQNNEYTLIKGSDIDHTLTYVYAPLADTIYSMDTAFFANLSVNEEDWYNKNLLNFKVEDVANVTFSYKSLETTLLPTATTNGIVFTSHNINDALSEKFINFIQNSKIEQFITTNASDHILDVYGFNHPSLRCNVNLNSGETLSLTIGNIKEDENICYAMVNNNKTIVAIPYFDFSQFDSLFAELEANNELILG